MRQVLQSGGSEIAGTLEQMAIGGWQIRFLAAHPHRACLRGHRGKPHQEGDIVNLLSRWPGELRIRPDDAIDCTTGNGRVVAGQVRP